MEKTVFKTPQRVDASPQLVYAVRCALLQAANEAFQRENERLKAINLDFADRLQAQEQEMGVLRDEHEAISARLRRAEGEGA